jgi:hypothetical protein
MQGVPFIVYPEHGAFIGQYTCTRRHNVTAAALSGIVNQTLTISFTLHASFQLNVIYSSLSYLTF